MAAWVNFYFSFAETVFLICYNSLFLFFMFRFSNSLSEKAPHLMLQCRCQKTWQNHISWRHNHSGHSCPALCCSCPCWGRCHQGAGPHSPCTDFSSVSVLGRYSTASIFTWTPFWNCRAAASTSTPSREQHLHMLCNLCEMYQNVQWRWLCSGSANHHVCMSCFSTRCLALVVPIVVHVFSRNPLQPLQ